MSTIYRDPKTDNLLTPENSALILIDYQPHILAGVKTMDHKKLVSNTLALVKTAKLFNAPIILSHVGVELFEAQPFLEEVTSILPDVNPVDRTSTNAWEEEKFRDALEKTGRKKLIMGGLWTEVCLAFPVVDLINEGYEIYVVEDVIGGANPMSHNNGMLRMTQAGAIPMTWNVVLAEYQRDHARKETEGGVTEIFTEHLFGNMADGSSA